LRANGYNVVAATDGIQAINVARKEEPDVIVLDLGLPASDGFTVMERLRSIIPLAHILVIVLTAREPLGNRERALSAGARAFLQKSVDNAVLLGTIREALGENNGRKWKKVKNRPKSNDAQNAGSEMI
jgi:CheY-like chemotaxis protein